MREVKLYRLHLYHPSSCAPAYQGLKETAYQCRSFQVGQGSPGFLARPLSADLGNGTLV